MLKAPSPELQAWLQVISVILTILGGIVAVYVALSIKTLHILVNSRLTELLRTTGLKERAEGDAAGTERERDRKERSEDEGAEDRRVTAQILANSRMKELVGMTELDRKEKGKGEDVP